MTVCRADGWVLHPLQQPSSSALEATTSPPLGASQSQGVRQEEPQVQEELKRLPLLALLASAHPTLTVNTSHFLSLSLCV